MSAMSAILSHVARVALAVTKRLWNFSVKYKNTKFSNGFLIDSFLEYQKRVQCCSRECGGFSFEVGIDTCARFG